MSKSLKHGDQVRYIVNGRRMRGTVQDCLPFMRDAFPVQKRKRTVWIERKALRKLPGKKGMIVMPSNHSGLPRDARFVACHMLTGFPMLTLFSDGVGRRHLSEHWREARDGDAAARAIFDRHYSRYRYADGREPKLFVGPGEKTVMLTEAGDALFVWRKFISADGQTGVNCAIFRNESPILSSSLIIEADAVAWARWPGERLYTYVARKHVRSTNPGCCFRRAGWKRCGVTKVRGLLIFERLP